MKNTSQGTIPLVALSLATIAALGVVAVQGPIWAVLIICVVGGPIAVTYGGVMTGSVCAALTVLGASGVINAYVPALTELSTLAVAYLAVLGAAQAVRVIIRYRRPGRLLIPVTVYLAFCAIAAFVTTFSSPVFAARGFLSLAFPVLAAIAIHGALTLPGKTPPAHRVRLLVTTLLVIVAANSLVALRQGFSGFNAAELVLIRSGVSTYGVGDTIRSMGLLPTNQDFGFMIACLAPAVLVAATHLTGKARTLVLFIGALAVLALITSLTRTALIAAILALIIGLFAWGRGARLGRVVKYSAVIGGVTAAIYLWFSTSSNIRIQETYDRVRTLTNLGDDRSLNDRAQDVYPRALAILADHPLGAGAGSAGPLSQQFPSAAPFGSLTTDSGYLMMAIQLGVPGALFMIWLLWRTVRALVTDLTPSRAAAATAVLSLGVAMALAGYWSLSAPAAVIAALVGLAFADTSTPIRAHKPQPLEYVRA